MRSTYLFRRKKSAPRAGKASICPQRLRCRPHRISRAHSRSRAETNAFQRRRIQPTTVGDRQTDDPAPRLCGEPAPPSLPCASNPPPDGLRGRLSSSQRTPRWRKPDSNHRSRLMCCALIQFGIGGRQISTVNASIATSIGPRQLRVEQIEAEPHGRETECRREMAPPPTRRPGLGAAHRGPSTYPAMK